MILLILAAAAIIYFITQSDPYENITETIIGVLMLALMIVYFLYGGNS